MSVIERPAETAQSIVWTIKDAAIDARTELRVRDGDVAVLMRWGSVVGVLKGGAHVLDPARVPFLANLFDPGSTHAQADVIFVATGEHGWHEMSAEPRTLADPRTGARVDVRFTGSFSMQVTDPMQLVMHMPDPSHDGIYRYVESTLDRVCRDVASEMVSGGVSVLDLCQEQHARALAARTIEAVAPKLEGSAMRVVRFGSLLVHVEAGPAAAPALAAGMRAMVRWTDGREYAARVQRVDGDRVEIAWDAGGQGVVTLGQVRPL